MTLAADVKALIEAAVPELNGQCHEAADLAELTRSGAMPNRIAAFVVPLGFDAAAPDVAAGLFRQGVTERIGVVLYVAAHGDPRAGRAIPEIDALKDAVIGAVAGKRPDNAIGVFALVRGRFAGVARGAVIYQIDFGLFDQLRIET